MLAGKERGPEMAPTFSVVNSVTEVPAAAWDTLVDENDPFLASLRGESAYRDLIADLRGVRDQHARIFDELDLQGANPNIVV